jgi:hypothetical protein
VRKWLLSLTLIGLAMLLFSIARRSPPPAPSSGLGPSSMPSTVLPSPEPVIRYQTHTLLQSVVHTLLIPVDRFEVMPALSPKLDTLEEFAQKHRAIAVLNGGFFDPQNYQSTSYAVLQGKLLADPKLNRRLMNNPDLAPYLDKILNRTEFRRYLCGTMVRYDIALHSEPPPTACQLVDALGGGPRLLPEITSVPEGFLDYANGKVVRDPLRSSQPDTRTAVGITRDGSIIWVMVAQKPGTAVSGMSLPGLADFMKTLGVEKAMNLDGGSSSSLYHNGKTFYGKMTEAGDQVRRPVKSVLLVQELEH